MEYRVVVKDIDGREATGFISVGSSAVFGRGSDATFVINDNMVSRAHCRLDIAADSTITIEDLGSSNGTRVAGSLISGKVRLAVDDVIDIGNTCIRLLPVTKASSTPPQTEHRREERLDTDSVNFAKKFDVDKGPVDDLDEAGLDPRDLALRLNAICNLASKLFGAKDEASIIDIAVDIVLDISKAERCSVIMHHESSGLLNPVASRYRSKLKAGEKFNTSNTVVRYVIKTGESVITENAGDDDRFDIAESIMVGNVSSVMCVPLATNDKVLGVIYTDSTRGYGGDFDNHTLAVMAAAAHQVAVAIERVRLHIGLEKMFFGSILALAASIEAKDKYTKGHSERVTCYSLMIADEMGLSEGERIVIELAGLLHDVGKIGVPESVLCSSGKLTEEEFELIKKHPTVGADIILKMPELGNMASIKEVANVVKSHHEKFDGMGYPAGIAGRRIPVGARILAVADTFDAVTSNRTYRVGLPVEKAIEILKECAGTQVDPEVLEAFLKVHAKGDIAYPEKVRAHVAFDPELLKESTVLSS